MYFNCPEMLFLFLKGMAGALAPFSYLVKYILMLEKLVSYKCLSNFSE